MSPQPAQDILIAIRGLRTGFGDSIIHDGLDLDVYRGEVLGIVGGSGTGKSVLLRTIIGLNRQLAGSIRVFGKDLEAINIAERRAVERRWGVLFQNGALFSSLRCERWERGCGSARKPRGGEPTQQQPPPVPPS